MTIFHYETFESTLKFFDSKGIANEKLKLLVNERFWWISIIDIYFSVLITSKRSNAVFVKTSQLQLQHQVFHL